MSVLIRVATALIQLAWAFSVDFPCANSLECKGFFFMALHTQRDLFLFCKSKKKILKLEFREEKNHWQNILNVQ